MNGTSVETIDCNKIDAYEFPTYSEVDDNPWEKENEEYFPLLFLLPIALVALSYRQECLKTGLKSFVSSLFLPLISTIGLLLAMSQLPSNGSFKALWANFLPSMIYTGYLMKEDEENRLTYLSIFITTTLSLVGLFFWLVSGTMT